MNEYLGIVVSASVVEGIKILLSPDISIETLEVGSLAVIRSDSGRGFLILVEDIRYDVKDATIYKEASNPILEKGIIEFIRNALMEANIEAIILAYREGEVIRRGGKIPDLGSKIYPIKEADIKIYYGIEDWEEYYPLGYPKIIGEDVVTIPVSLRDLFSLNFGIFGKAGTGKTYLANLLVSYGIIYNFTMSTRMNFLIFDMQGEYSFNLLDDKGNIVGPGVGNAFREEFDIYVADEDYTKLYSYVKDIRIPLYNLTREEFEYIIEPLNPPSGFKNNLAALQRVIINAIMENKGILKEAGINIDENSWIIGFLTSDYIIDKLIQRVRKDKKFIDVSGSIEKIKETFTKLHLSIVSKIRNEGGQPLLSSFEAGVRRISVFLDLPVSFLPAYSDRVYEIVDKIYRSDGGHVIVCFGGRWSRTIPLYMALANLIAHRLKMQIDESIAKGAEENRKIIIFLEEAHRFLGKDSYQYNPFGKLAREYRKFGVSVVPIDQKPSELDPDVTSMLWTKIIFNLADPRDIGSSLLGIENEAKYRKIIPTLNRGEALIYGVGVKIPVVLRIINYADILHSIIGKYKDLKSSQLTTKDLYGDL